MMLMYARRPHHVVVPPTADETVHKHARAVFPCLAHADSAAAWTVLTLQLRGRALHAARARAQVRCACCDGSAPGGSGREAEPRVMILFSGGVDSTLLAALAHRSLPEGMPIDLCNVCFDAGRSPDRLSAWSAMQELAGWAPARRWRLLEVDKTLQDADEHKCERPSRHPSIHNFGHPCICPSICMSVRHSA
eukprot:359434-Chlamydomonas_euryale.AAC.5